MDAVIIDGEAGGGGPVLRAALALSAVTGKPVRIARFRSNRPAPGIRAEHMAAIRTAMRCCNARVAGAAIGSSDLTFVPAALCTIEAEEAVANAGAVAPVLQMVALPLALAPGSSRLTLTGGTHVPGAPTIDFLESDWVPAMEAAGLPLSIRPRRAGYLPGGGGEILALIPGNGRPRPLVRPARANLKVIQGIAYLSRLPRSVGDRAAREARRHLRRSGVAVRVDVEERAAEGTGCGIHVVAVMEDGQRVGFSVLGDRNRPAERMAREAVNSLFAWLDTGAAVEQFLADQLLLPLSLADGPSQFTTSRITRNLLATADVVHRFLPARVTISGREGEAGEVEIAPGVG